MASGSVSVPIARTSSLIPYPGFTLKRSRPGHSEPRLLEDECQVCPSLSLRLTHLHGAPWGGHAPWGATGRANQNVVPRPNMLRRPKRPWCASTMRRQMSSPSPSPDFVGKRRARRNRGIIAFEEDLHSSATHACSRDRLVPLTSHHQSITVLGDQASSNVRPGVNITP